MRKVALIVTAVAALAFTGSSSASSKWVSNTWTSPSRNIACRYDPRAYNVFCMTRDTPHAAIVYIYGGRNGTFAGASSGFVVRNPIPVTVTPWTPVLSYNYHWTTSGINCVSLVTGMACRTKFGHGFFISRETQQVW